MVPIFLNFILFIKIIFRPNEVKRVLDANFSGREDYNLHVFQLLGLELWHRTFLD